MQSARIRQPHQVLDLNRQAALLDRRRNRIRRDLTVEGPDRQARQEHDKQRCPQPHESSAPGILMPPGWAVAMASPPVLPGPGRVGERWDARTAESLGGHGKPP